MHLSTDNTYFFMPDGSVKTLNTVNLSESGEIQLLVYDRTSPEGISILDTQLIQGVLTRNTEDYNKRLKDFIIFLTIDLLERDKNLFCNPECDDLYAYVMAVWNDDTKSVQILNDDDCTYSDKMCKYLLDLIDSKKYHDIQVVQYFHEVYYNQELVYDRYNEDWLIRNSGVIREHGNSSTEI